MCGEYKSEDEESWVYEQTPHALDCWLGHSLWELEVSEIASTNSSAGLHVHNLLLFTNISSGARVVFFIHIYIVLSTKQSNALQGCSATDINEYMQLTDALSNGSLHDYNNILRTIQFLIQKIST